MKPVKVRGERLLAELAELSRIGAADGGVSRLALSPADLEAREWFIGRARAAGLEVSVDPVGNILALEPEGPDPPLLSGSHLDSVPHGGRFDGALGVVSALEAVRAIREAPQAEGRGRLGTLVLAAEESSRFGAGCLGSRVLVGDESVSRLTELRDPDGVSFPEALNRCGLDAQALPAAIRRPGWFREFVELHIDQAHDLERAGVPIGLITAIAAPTRLWLKIRGQQAHSGAALMTERRDALAGAAQIVLAVEAAARARADRHIVGTVGVLRVRPGSLNMVPGDVEMGIDVRGVDEELVQEAVDEVLASIQRLAAERELDIDVSMPWRSQPVRIAEERVLGLEEACRAVGAEHTRLISRSAHDAMYLARHGPVAMLFVRNAAGVSHSPAESARDEDAVLGASVLATYLAHHARQEGGAG